MSDDEWAVSAEQALLEAALPLAAIHGWNRVLVRQAALGAGLGEADAELLLPEGARDLAALFSRRLDGEAAVALADVDPKTLKVRERIRTGVLAWLAAAGAHAAAARRWSAFLALPGNVPLGLRLAWASADAIWRWAGDTATDENHYTKRLLLSQILIAGLAVRLTSGEADAERQVDARIADVMAFERWKARLPRPSEAAHRAAAALGRLRYARSRQANHGGAAAGFVAIEPSFPARRGGRFSAPSGGD